MAKTTDLRDLLVEELRDLYHAEKQLVRAFPKLAKGAASDEVRQLIREGVDDTKGRIERLEQAFEALEERTKGKPCHAMEGLIEEAEELLEEDFSGPLRDAALVAAVQKMAHYGIASYGTVCAYARAVGEPKVAEILEASLDEKKDADQEMTNLAEETINPRAMGEADDEEEERSEEEERKTQRKVATAATADKASGARSGQSKSR